ncbi:hypothetical protein MSAN_02308000 [Mycena sanguinolenta]|uniref:Uncharacterized protein n=1 Tax=Mycena sanguinolenta TaxID=230812 RepID=A0A8H6X8B9_9AGAR|nr:hypothetical protein MSAN_02308000 [Mycena sanguinolenta]
MAQLRIFLGGKGSSMLSQALLQSGQQFCLVAVAAHVTILALFHLSLVIHSTLSVPTFTVVNAMACLVFRKIKFGLISADGISKMLGKPQWILNDHIYSSPIIGNTAGIR